MGLSISAAGLLSLAFLPAIFLAVVRLLGYPSDPLTLILRLVMSECIALFLAVVFVVYFRIKTRVPLPDST
jgi:hypothetical protein